MTVQPTDHVRFQQRKPYVKEIKTTGAPLLEQSKDRNDVVTLNSLNDPSKEQVLQAKGPLVKIVNAKNGTFDKTTIEVISDPNKQNAILSKTWSEGLRDEEVRITGFTLGDIIIVDKIDAETGPALVAWELANKHIYVDDIQRTVKGQPFQSLE